MSVTGLGRCGLCHKQIQEMTPVNSVMLGRPPRAYLVHAGCKSQEPEHVGYTVDGRGQLEPPYPVPQSSDEVQVVTSLGDFMPGVVPPEKVPAMPVKEQLGQRKPPVKKAAPKKKTAAKNEKVETSE
jgi:hypothetical protein